MDNWYTPLQSILPTLVRVRDPLGTQGKACPSFSQEPPMSPVALEIKATGHPPWSGLSPPPTLCLLIFSHLLSAPGTTASSLLGEHTGPAHASTLMGLFSPLQILSLQISPWLLPWPPSNLVSERVSSSPHLKLQPLLTEPSTPNPFRAPLTLYTLHVYMCILFCNILHIIHLFITYSMCLLLLLLKYTLHTSRDPRPFCSLIYPSA